MKIKIRRYVPFVMGTKERHIVQRRRHVGFSIQCRHGLIEIFMYFQGSVRQIMSSSHPFKNIKHALAGYRDCFVSFSKKQIKKLARQLEDANEKWSRRNKTRSKAGFSFPVVDFQLTKMKSIFAGNKYIVSKPKIHYWVFLNFLFIKSIFLAGGSFYEETKENGCKASCPICVWDKKSASWG